MATEAQEQAAALIELQVLIDAATDVAERLACFTTDEGRRRHVIRFEERCRSNWERLIDHFADELPIELAPSTPCGVSSG